MTNAWSLLYDELTMKTMGDYESPDGGKTVTIGNLLILDRIELSFLIMNLHLTP